MAAIPLAESISLREPLHLPSPPATAERPLDSIAQFDASAGTEHGRIQP